MQQESSDEFRARNCHRFDCVAVATVAVGERHVAVFDRLDAVVADGDAVRIAPKVVENFLGPAERRLAVDHPVLSVELPD